MNHRHDLGETRSDGDPTGSLPISRREAIGCGLASAAAWLLAGRRATGAAADTQPPKAKAKSVIQIWAAGGPPHLDTFDPKPEAGYDYCGPLITPIQTNVDGIRIGELLPLLAKQADKYSIIRSRLGTADAATMASAFPPSLPAADSRGAASSARRTPREKKSRIARSTPATCSAASIS